ncbi:putative transcriptional regulator [Methanonatronarchaeum thermophilum]|uniref:Putative HTH-type transcriptional regulatory protein AMET1_1129 n=1 Tax=Methanonatronarchaeum thermophilum TaxID=1927129 RepID=A0A1Y3GDF0_9EURY|nr:transcriptional regulator [Methanonatronarchaeum thermophilum]OUJ18224.1 putative transcriptional regulator [Methanonatronarchaeum thermophilum]
MTQALKDEVVAILLEGGYKVSDECTVYPKSFDYVAKKGERILVLKVLVDINSLRDDVAFRLSEISRLFMATPLVVGVKNRGEPMNRGVVYNRYGVRAVTPETLYDHVVEEIPFVVYSAPGGNYAKLNSERLRQARVEKGISRGELASKLGVSRSAIRKYEEGGDVNLDVAMEIEEVFDIPLFETVDISPDDDVEVGRDKIENPVLDLLSSLGLRVLPTDRAPFNALSRTERQAYLTGIEAYNERLKKKASIISSVSGTIDYGCFMVVKESKKDRSNIEDAPIVFEQEISDFDSVEDLLGLLDDRCP